MLMFSVFSRPDITFITCWLIALRMVRLAYTMPQL